MQPFTVMVLDIKTIQKGTPTPEHPVPIENYIKIADFGWFKQVSKEELEFLEENNNGN